MLRVRDDTNEVTDAALGRRDERKDKGADSRMRRVAVHVKPFFRLAAVEMLRRRDGCSYLERY